MTIKLKKVPLSSCYLTSGLDSDGIQFALLSEEDPEDDEEDDTEEDDTEAAAEGDGTEEDDAEGDGETDGSDDSEADTDEDEEAASEEKASLKRSFQMLAHTGKIVSRWWGNLILDMDGARYRQKLALIKDHRPDQPLGFSTSIKRTKRGLEATGRMLSNQAADEVIKYSREGYPWQASLMAVPTKVENLEAGTTSMVNGREVLGPMTIFREWEMHELTLTTLGADDNTTTEAFSADGEIEVQIMTTKKKTNAPTTMSGSAATETFSPATGAPVGSQGQPSEAELERQRASTILQSADPSQMELAQQLVTDGTPLTKALSQLNGDLKGRLQAASQNLRVAAQPIAAGNMGSGDGSGHGARSVNLSDLPSDPEMLAREWETNVQLRGLFDNKSAFISWRMHKGQAMHNGDDNKLAEKLGGGLKGLGYRNVQGNYFMRYDDMMGKLWYPRIVTEYSTDQDHEIFKWLGNVPNPRKWEGERQRSSLTDYGITVIGDKFELTVEADVDDVRRDKTGQILKRIGEMGSKMATLPQRLITTLIEANATAYDGLPFYSATHEVGNSGVQSNDITVSGLANPDAPTSEEMSRVILEGIKSLIGLKDDHGDPANEGAQKFLVVGPVKYMNVAAAALKNEFTSAGVSNTIRSTDFQIDWATNARFTGTAAAAGRRIYIFREDTELRSILWQKERISDAFMSEFDFWNDKLAWGGKDIVAAAPGRFELTNRINLAA